MKAKQYLHLVVAMLAVSCATIDRHSIRVVNKLDSDDYEQLEGRYLNNPDDGAGKSLRSIVYGKYQWQPLWANINQYRTHPSAEWQKQTVDIDFVTSHKAVFKLYEGDSLVSSKTVRGKFKDGFFYKRPAFVIIPFFPLGFGYKTHRVRIGKFEDAIIVDYKWNVWVSVFISGIGEKGYSSLLFNKR